MTKSLFSSKVLSWSLLGLLSIVWGSSFILIKKALIAFSPLQVGAGRVVIAFIAFTPLFIYHFNKIPWNKVKPLFAIGLLGSGLPAVLYAIAQTHIASGVAGLLNALTPIFTFLLAIMVFGRSFSWKHLLGISLGFLGTLTIFCTKQDGLGHFPFSYGLLIVLATFCYGISANTVGRYLQDVPPIIISTVSFSLVGPWMLIYLLGTDFLDVINQHPEGGVSFAALLVLSLVGTFGANILFFKLIQITDPVFSSSVSFITPIVAFMWGFLDGEYFSFYFFLALIMILTGLFLIKFTDK